MKDLGYMLGGMPLLTQSAETQKTNTYWTLLYIRRGIGMYILDSNLRPINQGDIIVLPPKLAYSFCSNDLGDEYNINIKASVLRFDNAWLDALVATFPVAGEMVLKIKEIRNPLAVEGPKWIKLSKLLDQILSCQKHDQPVVMFAVLSLMATPSDFVVIKSIQQCDQQDVEERKARIDRFLECNYYWLLFIFFSV